MVDNTQESEQYFCVASDGSDSSHDAFNLCFNEFYQKSQKLLVLSVVDKSKTNLPTKYTPQSIYNHYHQILLSHIPSSKYNILLRDKDGDVKSTILQTLDQYKISLLFIGYHGRKGAKADTTIMGTTVKNSAYQSTVPICIVKDYTPRKENESKGYTFLVCLDGSEKAYRGLQVAKQIATNPKDTVVGLSVEASDTVQRIKAVKEHFDEFIKESKLNGKHVTTPIKAGEKIIDRIIHYLKMDLDTPVDFVIFGNNGIRSQNDKSNKIGTLAEALITDIKSNSVMIP